MIKRKIVWLSLLLLILLYVMIYFFIPGNQGVSTAISFHGNASAVSRSVANEEDWKKWWPGHKTGHEQSTFFLGDYSIKIEEKLYHAVDVQIRKGGDVRKSSINIFSPTKDSILILWHYDLRAGRNPISRIYGYFEALQTKEIMNVILAHMQSFLEVKDNIYGIRISQIMSNDSTLITTKFQTKAYPTTDETYHAINSLKEYAARNHAKEINFPMKQTNAVKGGGYETEVAIPVDKALRDKGKIILKRYVPWKEMMGEVTGGDSTINRGFQQFKIFLQEYQYMQMAAPFESLVTDRSREPDTTKWITRFNCPIP
jgi:hypothetical protein